MHEAEQRVFSSGEKRAFDTAIQEMLNQATIEVRDFVKHVMQNSSFSGLLAFSSELLY